MNAAVPDSAWRRLSPLSPLVQLGRGTLAVLILVVPGLVSGHSESLWNLLVYAVLIPLGIVAGVIRWLVTRWRIADGVLQKEEGLLRRQSLRFPLTQIQAVDVLRPGLARVFGLSELRLRMGGAAQGGGRLAYLRADEALALRRRLLAGDSEQAATTAHRPAAPVLFAVSTLRLLASLLLDLRGLVLLAAAVVVVAYAGWSGAVIWVVPTFATIWRRVNDEFGLRVTEAGEALHVEGGLIATSAETIPSGRVQAVKLIEPILWRPFGWCRLQVSLAGSQGRDRDANTGAVRSARTLVPVGTRAEADALLRLLVPAPPAERRRAPGRARLKSPLAYGHLAWGRTDAVAVTVAGRLVRITSWVPLEKVQSLRRVQGPVQRLLRLETVHLDTAGRGVHAALRDRDVVEGDHALAALVDLCRAARRTPGVSPAAAAPA